MPRQNFFTLTYRLTYNQDLPVQCEPSTRRSKHCHLITSLTTSLTNALQPTFPDPRL